MMLLAQPHDEIARVESTTESVTGGSLIRAFLFLENQGHFSPLDFPLLLRFWCNFPKRFSKNIPQSLQADYPRILFFASFSRISN